MPTYTFKCEKCKTFIDLVFKMKEDKESNCKECGKKLVRVFSVPNMAMDSKINPYDLDAMTKKTGNMKGTVGDLWRLASEASEKRGGDDDPIRKKAIEDYAKKRKGKKYRGSIEGKSNAIDIQIKPT